MLSLLFSLFPPSLISFLRYITVNLYERGHHVLTDLMTKDMVLVLLPLGTELDVSVCIVFFLQKINCLLFMFQVEKEAVQREKEDQCICIPKTSMVAMVLLVLRYIHLF